MYLRGEALAQLLDVVNDYVDVLKLAFDLDAKYGPQVEARAATIRRMLERCVDFQLGVLICDEYDTDRFQRVRLIIFRRIHQRLGDELIHPSTRWPRLVPRITDDPPDDAIAFKNTEANNPDVDPATNYAAHYRATQDDRRVAAAVAIRAYLVTFRRTPSVGEWFRTVPVQDHIDSTATPTATVAAIDGGANEPLSTAGIFGTEPPHDIDNLETTFHGDNCETSCHVININRLAQKALRIRRHKRIAELKVGDPIRLPFPEQELVLPNADTTSPKFVAKRGATTGLTVGQMSAIEAVVRRPGHGDDKDVFTWELLIIPGSGPLGEVNVADRFSLAHDQLGIGF
ncbi:hypothetical protein F5Y10DRAFT_272432 [Nemania abortiva]|nr:hypothetical protein F5Y10DRAFT_272432 [Nemania abortiva]